MRRLRLIGVALLAAAGMFVAGCTSTVLPVVSPDEASIGDTVLAIRLSPQLRQINEGADDGYLLLVDQKGSARAVNVGAMDDGGLLWSDAGLFLAGPTDELVLADDGLTAIARGSHEVIESVRFLAPDTEGFIAVYNSGFTDEGYLHRVAAGGVSRVETWDVEGLFGSISQCEDVVVGITDLSETSLIAADAGTEFDALMQLYPQPESAESGVLGTLPVDGAFEFEDVAQSAPCIDDVIYAVAFHYDTDDGTSPGSPVLRVWDTTTGEHSVLPLVNKSGEKLVVTLDDLSHNPGTVIDRTTYVWVDWCCDSSPARVLATDLTTGVTTHRFDLALSSPEMGESQFVFTESSIFVLDVNQDIGAALDFSRYDLATGERADLFTITGTGSVHDGLEMVIRDIAIAPDWLKVNE